jgi:Holliday junction resolvase RusA-like endonuclease
MVENSKQSGIREKDYAKCLARLVKEKKVHLHILFADFNNFVHTASGPLKRKDSTGKMHYQLILHRALQYYGTRQRLHIRPDGGDCTAKLNLFRPKLLEEGWGRYKAKSNCIASIVPQNSEKEPLLQLLDVTLGAFAALRNERHLRPEVRAGKRDLANLVHQLYDYPDLLGDTEKAHRVFSIWNFEGGGPNLQARLPELD